MIRLLYQFLFPLFFILAAPVSFWKMWRRGGWKTGFWQRFGILDSQVRQTLSEGPNLWLHAVSVGEVGICLRLAREIRERAPQYRLVLTTTTTTGMGELRTKAPEGSCCLYYPSDFFGAVRRTLKAIHPVGLVLMEAEIWPNLLWACADRQIPMALVNARLSDRSTRGYLRFRSLFHELFQNLSLVGAQDAADTDNLVSIGCIPDRILVTGSLKFDAANRPSDNLPSTQDILSSIGWNLETPFLVGGSTHPGEEALLARVVQDLRKVHPAWRLIVVPRHMERASRAVDDLRSMGLRVQRRSELSLGAKGQEDPDVLVVDTTGELMSFYQVADLVIVGKSLLAEGGQNPIEPASLGCPVLFGPHMKNFRRIVDLLLRRQAALQVRDEDHLKEEVLRLADNPVARKTLGESGRRLVEENQGATGRTAEAILKAFTTP